ncbi:MAG: ribosomal protection-like ABC-F family protein [Saccharofermentanales bacterium]|jgi:ATP-binding cassette subfamily F protein 3
MSLVVARHISKAYQGRTVLDDLSFSIERGDRIGLVGINGSGKTTLMGIIRGAIQPDTGTISRASSFLVSYLDQRPLAVDLGTSDVLENTRFTEMEHRMKVFERDMERLEGDALKNVTEAYSRVQTVYEASGVYDYRARLARALAGLGLSNDQIDQPYETLSGGEKMRVALGRFLLQKSDLMLLDEPTNHLDLDGLEWLQTHLVSTNGTMMIVSHDRWFLDHVCTSIFELESGKIYIYQGNYSASRERKRAIEENRDRTLERLETEIKRQDAVTQTMLSHRKMKSYHSREKVVRKLKDEMQALRVQKNPKRRMTFSVVSSTDKKDMNRVLLEVENLSLAYDRTLFQSVSFHIRAHDRVALLGPNGCGKTSLLHVLLGRREADDGHIRLFGDPSIAFMGQTATFDDESLTVYAWLAKSFPRTETAIRSRLAQYGFREESMIKRIESLSGGERHRLNLCSLLEQAPDLMVLDEPTNHLDIESRHLLEEALTSFKGAVVIVSHDRAFIQAASTRILGFVGTSILPFDRYEDWRDAALDSHANQISASSLTGKEEYFSGVATHRQDEQNDADKRSMNPAELRRARAEYRQRVATIEEAIHSHESEREAFENADLTTHKPEDYEAYAILLSDLEQLYKSYFSLLEEGEPSAD